MKVQQIIYRLGAGGQLTIENRGELVNFSVWKKTSGESAFSIMFDMEQDGERMRSEFVVFGDKDSLAEMLDRAAFLLSTQ